MDYEASFETPVAADSPAARTRDALEFLRQCWDTRRGFAVLTGSSPADIRRLVQKFTAELPAGVHVAKAPAPSDSSQGFLEQLLAEFELDPSVLSADDLQRLLTVVLKQSASRKARCVLIINDLQDYGPRVLETIRALADDSRQLEHGPFFLLTGHVGLNRVLDSQGMASIADLTRSRWNLDHSDTGSLLPSPVAGSLLMPAAAATLVVTRDHEVIGFFAVDRDRLLIGRSALSDICLNSRYISRQHALLLRSSDGLWLVDLKSTNGTLVNSEFVHHRRIEPGDIISLGDYRLRYADECVAPSADMDPLVAGEVLNETVVMRSLQGIVRSAAVDRDAGPTSTAA